MQPVLQRSVAEIGIILNARFIALSSSFPYKWCVSFANWAWIHEEYTTQLLECRRVGDAAYASYYDWARALDKHPMPFAVHLRVVLGRSIQTKNVVSLSHCLSLLVRQRQAATLCLSLTWSPSSPGPFPWLIFLDLTCVPSLLIVTSTN